MTGIFSQVLEPGGPLLPSPSCMEVLSTAGHPSAGYGAGLGLPSLHALLCPMALRIVLVAVVLVCLRQVKHML